VVLDLDILGESDLPPALYQAMSQLDVLNTGPPIALGIESSKSLENRSPNRSATGPEGRRLLASLLVDEVMLQILESGHEPRGTGSVIIGAEQSVELGLLVEDFNRSSQSLRSRAAVRIDKEQHFAMSPSGAQIPSGSRTLASRSLEYLGAGRGSNFHGPIGRAVVYNDQLPVGVAGTMKVPKASAQCVGPIENGNHDRQIGSFGATTVSHDSLRGPNRRHTSGGIV
jgi:hypothetical protein